MFFKTYSIAQHPFFKLSPTLHPFDVLCTEWQPGILVMYTTWNRKLRSFAVSTRCLPMLIIITITRQLFHPVRSCCFSHLSSQLLLCLAPPTTAASHNTLKRTCRRHRPSSYALKRKAAHLNIVRESLFNFTPRVSTFHLLPQHPLALAGSFSRLCSRLLPISFQQKRVLRNPSWS